MVATPGSVLADLRLATEVEGELRGQPATERLSVKPQGGSGVLSLRHFGAGSLYPLIPWRVGAEESGAAKYGSMASAAPSPISFE
jgi:hypothetical protein